MLKLTQLMSIFTSKNFWKFVIKNQLTKSGPKRIGGWKVPSLMPIRVNTQVLRKHNNFYWYTYDAFYIFASLVLLVSKRRQHGKNCCWKPLHNTYNILVKYEAWVKVIYLKYCKHWNKSCCNFCYSILNFSAFSNFYE